MCCHNGCGGCCRHSSPTPPLTEAEHALLQEFAQLPFLPLAQFILASSRSPHARSVALSPVYLRDEADSLEQIKATGALLLSLEEKGLVSLDFDLPLQGFNYASYHSCPAFRQLEEAVQEGSRRADFLFNQALLETGSMALTALGCEVVEDLAFLL